MQISFYISYYVAKEIISLWLTEKSSVIMYS